MIDMGENDAFFSKKTMITISFPMCRFLSTCFCGCESKAHFRKKITKRKTYFAYAFSTRCHHGGYVKPGMQKKRA